MKTTTNPDEIAAHIVGQMNDDDRANFTADGWRPGVSGMLVDEWEGADLDKVLERMGWACAPPWSFEKIEDVAKVYEASGPTEDGDPCANCTEPVWYCNDDHTWYHIDPTISCFLSNGKAPPVAS